MKKGSAIAAIFVVFFLFRALPAQAGRRAFTTTSIPTISSISPTIHEAGSFTVIINGTNFQRVNAVTAISTSTGTAEGSTTYIVNSSTRITATVNLPADTYYLKVTTSKGKANTPNLVVSALQALQALQEVPVESSSTGTAPLPAPTPTPAPPAPQATSYNLKTPLPAIVNDGTVSEGVSTSGNRCMWRGANGNINLLATFGYDSWFGHYVNTATGVNALITGPRGAAGWWAYNPTYDKMYIGGSYAGSLAEFDSVNRSLKTISNTIATCINLLIGDDYRVYYAAQGNRLYSYDPSLGYPGGWKNYGVVHADADSSSNYFTLAVDATHVYCGVKHANGTWTLVISPISGTPRFTEWAFGNAGDTGLSISKEFETSNWICTRTLANGSDKVYYLHNGTYTDTGLSFIQGEYYFDKAPQYCAYTDNEASYHIMTDTYGWEPDFTNLFPVKDIHQYSAVKYRRVGASTWNESILDYTGPWVPQIVQCVVPGIGNNNIFAFSEGYNAAINLNYVIPASSYLGSNNFSPYRSMQHPSGEIYVGGYSDKVLRYDPDLPWTLTSSNSTPRLPSDSTKPNPYFIKMSPVQLHYRHGLAYSYDGTVWIGGNTTRDNPNYGDVMWYNTNDGSTGYMFPAWSTSGTYFSNLCATNNRLRICVSDNKDNIWIIDAATKLVDPVPINPMGNGASKTYMIEVENDIVFGIVISAAGNKVIRFNPSTKHVLTLQDLGASGTPFGFGDNQYDRMSYKLELGPDGYIWMFVGDSLYRVNPTTCLFTKVLDTPCSRLKFSSNLTDLLLYCDGTTDFKYIPGILVPVP